MASKDDEMEVHEWLIDELDSSDVEIENIIDFMKAWEGEYK